MRLTRGLLPRKVLSKLSFISTYSTADQDKQPPLKVFIVFVLQIDEHLT